MAPYLGTHKTFSGSSGYPMSLTTTFDAASAPALIVAVCAGSSSGYSAVTPTATFGGQTMTLLGKGLSSSSSGSSGATWVFGLLDPPTGTQTLAVSAAMYVADTVGILLPVFDGTDTPFGAVAGGLGEPTVTLSIDQTSGAALLLAFGQDSWTSGVALTASSGWTEVVSEDGDSTSLMMSLFERSAEDAGTYSITLTAPFNPVSGVLLGINGTPDLVANPTGIAGSTVVGSPALRRDGIGPTGIASTLALGTPTTVGPVSKTLPGIASTLAVGSPTVKDANSLPHVLGAGESIQIVVKFAPTSAGAKTATLSVIGGSVTYTAALSGTAEAAAEPALQRLSISGNELVNEDGEIVRLRSVNWHGAEGTNYTPHGTWIRSYTSILDQIKGFGFNCIRVPFSGAFESTTLTPPTTAIDFDENPTFSGKTSLEILDLIFDYCAEIGLYVVLDHHRRAAGDGADGGPTDSSYTETDWLATWAVMANRYKDHIAVVGADVHNEPYNLTWDAWATLAETCGNSILAIAPDWLIFVEGVGNIDSDYYWWGGQLAGVATRPVSLDVANKVIYSPHEYGQSVGTQTWLAYDGGTEPANWPLNLYAVWQAHWGFIYEQGIAPIWIGEFGGHYGYDGSGNLTKPHATYETQWTAELSKYLNGDFDGDGTSDIASTKKGMSFAYWTYNPTSADTGGLLCDDWVTVQTGKLAILASLLSGD